MSSSQPVQSTEKVDLKGAANLALRKSFTQSGKPWKLFSSLPYYMLIVFYYLSYIALKEYHNPYWVIAMIYLGIPILDFFSQDWLNPDNSQIKLLEKSILFQIPLYAMVIIDSVFFIWALHFLSTHEFPLVFYPGAIFLCGVLAACNFLIAHELFHKPTTGNRVLGTLTMWKNLYMHFFIEHTFGHHKNVATPNDPATARYQETLYHFLPRSIIGSYKSAWNIEKKRLVQKKGFKTHWVPQNRMIWFTLSYIVIPLITLWFLGAKGCVLMLAIAGWSITVLEAINYVEHYGLMRQQIGPNEYEKVNITHSWNAPQRFSNYLLFKLQRHSDHHENAYKPYQTLSTPNESPMLPHGYTLCLIITFFPQLWFGLMDRILLAYKEKRSMTEEEVKTTNRESVVLFIKLGFIYSGLFTWTHLANNM